MRDRRDEAPWAADPPDGAADPERLAALLDGRLDGAERDALLARLADHDDDLALFAEAAAIQRALEEEDAAAGMADASLPHIVPAATGDDGLALHAGAAAVPRALKEEDAAAGASPYAAPVAVSAAPRPSADGVDETAEEPDVIPLRRPAPRLNRRLALLAAVLAGVTLLPLAWRAARPGAISSPTEAVAMLESRDAGVPPGMEPRPWGTTRGGGDPLVERSMSARVGAYAVDLELAIRAGDEENRRIFANDAMSALDSATAMAQYGFRFLAEPMNAGRDEQLSQLQSAMELATQFLDEEFVALGGWAEAARFAAERRDAEFFHSRRTARTLEKAEPLLADSEAGRSALARIGTARAADPPDWPALTSAVNELIRAIAS